MSAASEAAARAHSYDLFESVLSGLEQEEMRAHLYRATGEEPTPDDVETVVDEWLALRRYLARRRKQIQKQVPGQVA